MRIVFHHKFNTAPGRTFSDIAVFNLSGLVDEGKANEVAEWFRFSIDGDFHGDLPIISERADDSSTLDNEQLLNLDKV